MPFPFSFLARKQKHTKGPEIFDNEDQGERQVLTTVYRAENPVIEWVASTWTELTLFRHFLLFPSIVAVHGLNGDAIKSFTSGKNQKFWLGDEDMLPRDLANCRILTFSYPASVAAVFGKTSSETILQHATTLVHESVADRQMDKGMERPVVFLCHSLGGIIVKRVWERFSYSQSVWFPVTDLGPRHSSTPRLVKVKQWNISTRFSSRHMGSFSLERRIREAAKPTLLHSCSVWLLHYHPNWSIRIPDYWTP